MRYVRHSGKHFSVAAMLSYKSRIFLLSKKSSKAKNVRILLTDAIKSNVLLSSTACIDIMNILGCFCYFISYFQLPIYSGSENVFST